MAPALGLLARFLYVARFGAAAQGRQVREKARPGFGGVVNKDGFDEQYGYRPGRPGDKSRFWGINSSAASPMFGGVLREDVAQQRGHRLPAASDFEEGKNSGFWLAIADPGATVTVPAVAPQSAVNVIGAGRFQVKENAVLLGKVLATRLGERT